MIYAANSSTLSRTIWKNFSNKPDIVLNEKHLLAVLDDYINNYYNVSRTHMSLKKDSPVSRPVQTKGKIVAKPVLGGLHHNYSRVA